MSLEDENRFLRGIAEEQTKKIDDLKKTISSAVEAQNKLQKELDQRERTDNEGWKLALNHLNNIMEVIQTENHKLGEDNEKGANWASEVIHWSHSASLDNLQAKKLITDKNQPTVASVRDFGKEIKQLKNQNEHLTTFSLLVGAIEGSIDWDEWRHILENAGWIYDDENEKYSEVL